MSRKTEAGLPYCKRQRGPEELRACLRQSFRHFRKCRTSGVGRAFSLFYLKNHHLHRQRTFTIARHEIRSSKAVIGRAIEPISVIVARKWDVADHPRQTQRNWPAL